MKTFLLSLVVLALLLGCTRRDPIDRLVASCADSKFPNGFWKPIKLPSTAEPGDLALMALRSEDATATNFAVISTRKVRIVGEGHGRSGRSELYGDSRQHWFWRKDRLASIEEWQLVWSNS